MGIGVLVGCLLVLVNWFGNYRSPLPQAGLVITPPLIIFFMCMFYRTRALSKACLSFDDFSFELLVQKRKGLFILLIVFKNVLLCSR